MNLESAVVASESRERQRRFRYERVTADFIILALIGLAFVMVAAHL